MQQNAVNQRITFTAPTTLITLLRSQVVVCHLYWAGFWWLMCHASHGTSLLVDVLVLGGKAWIRRYLLFTATFVGKNKVDSDRFGWFTSKSRTTLASVLVVLQRWSWDWFNLSNRSWQGRYNQVPTVFSRQSSKFSPTGRATGYWARCCAIEFCVNPLKVKIVARDPTQRFLFL